MEQQRLLPAGPRSAGPVSSVDPRAVVDPGARLASGVVVGPFAVVGPEVEIGEGTLVGAHSVIEGRTRLGRDNRVGPHVVLGAPAQVRERDGAGALVIGDCNQLREFCTVHCGSGSGDGGGVTVLGDGNWLMAYSHVAHDCRIGDGVELANGVQLAGHVEVGDRAVLGGLAAVHQFVRVGSYSLVGAGAMVAQDVPPFCQVAGDRARLYGINVVGLRRAGFDAATRRALGRALAELRRTPLRGDAVAAIESDQELVRHAPVVELVQFVNSARRGICRPTRVVGRTGEERER